MSAALAGVRALLLDLEGTLFEAGRPVPGAAEALSELARRGIALRYITNTTSRPRRVLAEELAAMGLPAAAAQIHTAPLAGRALLLEEGWTRAHLLVRPALSEDFAGIQEETVSPHAVVLGDLGEETTYEALNRAFRLLLDGAAFVTLARNRYYRGADGLRLDQGPFAAALEYASGRSAILAGKPSRHFFATALSDLGVPASETRRRRRRPGVGRRRRAGRRHAWSPRAHRQVPRGRARPLPRPARRGHRLGGAAAPAFRRSLRPAADPGPRRSGSRKTRRARSDCSVSSR